jgi:hypothetical protein
MRHLSRFWISGAFCLAASVSHASPAFDGIYGCAMGADFATATKALGAGQTPIKLTVQSNRFSFSGGLVVLQGNVKPVPLSDANVMSSVEFGSMTAITTFALDSPDAPKFGYMAIGLLANGKRGAMIQPSKAKRAFVCVDVAGNTTKPTPDQTAGQSNKTVSTPPVTLGKTGEIRPKKRLLKGDDPLKPMPAAEQRGKEASFIGGLSKTLPDEGHYSCKTVQVYSDGTNKQEDAIGNHDDNSGFDLFADGTYRLSGKEETLGKGTFRAGPGAGAIIFDEGILSIYFKGAIHARKANGPSILYETDYDSDGALDEIVLCLRDGPTKTVSAAKEVAEKARKALTPPAHSGEPIDGLFYSLTWISSFGPDFTMYQNASYDFRFFQPNGYVWLGELPTDGDFDRLGCNKPIVDDQGESLCTTYSLEAGKLRIGTEAAIPAKVSADEIGTDSTDWNRIPPVFGRPYNKSYRYFSYNGVAAFEGNISFTSGGAFQSSSGVGISYTTPDAGSGQTTVSGYNEKDPVEGSYSIDRYSIIITRKDGLVLKRFFAQLAEGMLYFNGEAYLDRDN